MKVSRRTRVLCQGAPQISTPSVASIASHTPRLPLSTITTTVATPAPTSQRTLPSGRQNTATTSNISTMSANTMALVKPSARSAPFITCSSAISMAANTPTKAPRHNHSWRGCNA